VLPNFRLGEYGIYGERAIVPARSLLTPPAGLSTVEAASIWMQYFTALAIIDVAHAGVGDYVIIRAASSSVGVAAIQLANWAGAVSIATTRNGAKAAALEQQGAKHVIATEETDLVAEVQRITGGKGARVIFDPVGGPEVEKLAQAAAEEGIIFIYGGLSGKPTLFPHWPAALKSLSIKRLGVFLHLESPGAFRAQPPTDPTGTGLRPSEARHCAHVSACADRRGASLHGVESTCR